MPPKLRTYELKEMGYRRNGASCRSRAESPPDRILCHPHFATQPWPIVLTYSEAIRPTGCTERKN